MSQQGCPVTGEGNGCTTSIGVWDSTESATGEACTAATMNAAVTNASTLVNSCLTLMVGMICAANVSAPEATASSGASDAGSSDAGSSDVGASDVGSSDAGASEGSSNDAAPLAVGASIDMASVLSANVAGARFDVARLERLPDQPDGTRTWRISLAGSVSSSALSDAPIPISAVLTHAPKASGDAIGQLHGWLDLDGEGRRGFSVAYQLAGGALGYELRSGLTPTAAAGDDVLFDASGTYRFDEVAALAGTSTGEWGSENFERAQLDVATGLGSLVHAWQAGPSAVSPTQVFEVHTEAGASSAQDSGFGYFGYGPSTVDTGLGSISGMSCWPGTTTTRVQAQAMRRDAGTGHFVPTEDHITYAPTATCDASDTAATHFVYSATASSNAALEALTPHDVTSDLGLAGRHRRHARHRSARGARAAVARGRPVSGQ